jgi:hypothetical protein
VPHLPSSRPRGKATRPSLSPSSQLQASNLTPPNHTTLRPYTPTYVHHPREKRKRDKQLTRHSSKMTGAKYNEAYKKVSTMGEKLKAAGKQGPSNDEQLHVRPFPLPSLHTKDPYDALVTERMLTYTCDTAIRVRQSSRRQGLQRCEETGDVRFGCTSATSYHPPSYLPPSYLLRHTAPLYTDRKEDERQGLTTSRARRNTTSGRRLSMRVSRPSRLRRSTLSWGSSWLLSMINRRVKKIAVGQSMNLE